MTSKKEGNFYTWKLDDIKNGLNLEKAEQIIEFYNITAKGNFEGKNILNRLQECENNEKDLNAEEKKILDAAKQELFKIREKRAKPFLDKKIICSWNGLMIGALAYISQVFENKKTYQMAKKCAEFILNELKLPDNNLAHIYIDGQAKVPGFIDDYAFLAHGLLELYETDFDERWLKKSIDLTDEVIEKFTGGNGKYYLRKSGDLFANPISGEDQAIPSGVSIHAENLIRLSSITGNIDYLKEVENILKAYNEELKTEIWSYASLLMVLDNYYQGNRQFTFITDKAKFPEMLLQLRKTFIPYRVVCSNINVENPALHPAGNLIKDKVTINGKPTCYVCQGFQCSPPVTEWKYLERIIIQDKEILA